MTENLKTDCKRYVDALNSAPNAWGQHIIDGAQSHSFLHTICKRHGKEEVNAELDNLFGIDRKESN